MIYVTQTKGYFFLTKKRVDLTIRGTLNQARTGRGIQGGIRLPQAARRVYKGQAWRARMKL
jgi:hypothetical protein